MKTVSKTITGALAAALLTTAAASPAAARDRRYEHRRGSGISLGDVVLGTIGVVGVGVAVGALSSGRRDRDRRYEDRRYEDRRYDDRGYGRHYETSGYETSGYETSGYGRGYRDDQRASIEACSAEAQREAGQRFGSAGRVEVRNVDAYGDGYSVRGTVLVDARTGGDRYYDRGRSGRVAFSCSASYGEVADLRLGSSLARAY